MPPSISRLAREEGGAELAERTGAAFVACDVSDPEQNEAAVAVAVEEHGGLDMAFLNAGVTSGTAPREHFDLEAYRRAMSVNLDGALVPVTWPVSSDPICSSGVPRELPQRLPGQTIGPKYAPAVSR